MNDPLHRLTSRIRDARRITVVTGAGISAASGVPTFRGPGGLWRQYRPEELATPGAFARDPSLVWEWYEWRRERVASCAPNRGHEVLAAWTHRYPGCRIVTQNVDDLHVRAGTRGLVRLHGSIWELSCWSGCRSAPRTWRDEQVPLPQRPPGRPSAPGRGRGRGRLVGGPARSGRRGLRARRDRLRCVPDRGHLGDRVSRRRVRARR